MTVKNSFGVIIDFDAAVMNMDDEVRESVHNALAPCTEQEFFTAYETAHEEKFGEEWELSKTNPIY